MNYEQSNGDSLEMVGKALKRLRNQLKDVNMIDDTITDYGIIMCASWLVRLYSDTAQFDYLKFDTECSDGLKRFKPAPQPTWDEQS
jgi:hypothetical protein